MNKIQKISSIIKGIVYIIVSVYMLINPEDGYLLMLGIIALWLTLYGAKILVYFFTMAQFMVGGKKLLFKGLIFFDFGIFTTSLTMVPRIYVLLYLALLHAFSGLVKILRALEALRYGAKSWKLKMGHGLLNIFITASCFYFYKNANAVVIIYSMGLIYSAILSVISALRKTTMVYIQ